MTERELRALGAYVDFPPEHDLGPVVRARLDARTPRRRRALVVALAAALLAIAVAFAVPPARSSILRFFHLRGVSVRFVDKLPVVTSSAELDLGNPITLDEARRTLHFRPLTSDLLGKPDRVTWDGHQLWFVYGHTRVLVSQLRATEVSRYIEKLAGPGTTIAPVDIDGSHGLFLTGASHFIYLAPSRIVFDERIRLAKDTLLVERGPVTLRIEGDLTLDEALKIARSFH